MRYLFPLLLIAGLLAACGQRYGSLTPPDRMATPENESPTVLFNFDADTPASSWRIEDDVVMGGRSDGDFSVTDEGYGRFTGEVSLENNGGFSSVEHVFDSPRDLTDKSRFLIKIKGDGKDYNFRVQRPGERHSYRYTFSTNGEWQTVSIPFSELQPTYRGRTPDVAPYAGEPIRSIRFLIGNKKPQEFALLIDTVEVD